MGLFGSSSPGWLDTIGGIASVMGDGYAAYRGQDGGHLDAFLDDLTARQRRRAEEEHRARLERYALSPPLARAMLGPQTPRVQPQSRWIA